MELRRCVYFRRSTGPACCFESCLCDAFVDGLLEHRQGLMRVWWIFTGKPFEKRPHTALCNL